MAVVQISYPALPDAQRLSSGRPVLAADVSTLTNALNHLAGHRLRNVIQCPVVTDASVLQVYDGDGYAPHAPAGVSHTVNIALAPVQPHTEHLFLVLRYMAEDEGTEPNLVAALKSLDAVTTYDIGVKWRRDDGTLPVGASDMIMTCHTGTIEEDALRTGGAPSGPRLIAVPSAARGNDAQVIVTATNARVLWVTICEFTEAEV